MYGKRNSDKIGDRAINTNEPPFACPPKSTPTLERSQRAQDRVPMQCSSDMQASANRASRF
jgi:hypothetical protein